MEKKRLSRLSTRGKTLIILCLATLVGLAVAVPIVERQLNVTVQTGPRLFEMWNADKSAQITSIDYGAIYPDQTNTANLTIIRLHNTQTTTDRDLNITVQPSASFDSADFNLYINTTNAFNQISSILWNNGPGGSTIAYGHQNGLDWVWVNIYLWLKPGASPPAGPYDFQLLFDASVGSYGSG